MKKILLTTLLLLILTLTACNGASNTSQVSSTQEGATLPAATQLIVGTLKLDGTGQVVTSEQANELLIMWQVYQDLISSDTAAQEEIDGLVEQIQETMTTEQMKAISAMNLTQQDVFTLMQEQGVGMGQVQQSSNSNSSTQSGGGFAPPDGGMMGGPPDGGGAPPDGGMGDMAGMGGAGPGASTDQTRGTGAGSGIGGNAGIPSVLIDALIQLLEQKAES